MARKQPAPTEHDAEATPELATESVEATEAAEIMEAEAVQQSTEAPQTALERTAAPFAEAIHEGIGDARAAAASFRGILHKGVYNGFYYLTYGVVFGSLVVGSFIPSNNAMGDGVREGFKAARKDFEAKQEAGHSTDAPISEEGLAAA